MKNKTNSSTKGSTDKSRNHTLLALAGIVIAVICSLVLLKEDRINNQADLGLGRPSTKIVSLQMVEKTSSAIASVIQ